MPPYELWIGLGANLGHRQETLERALLWLKKSPALMGLRHSGFYLTDALGPPQPEYLNAVAHAETKESPQAILRFLQSLEKAAKRKREAGRQWGPRTLDLDLLMMRDRRGQFLSIRSPFLSLPHPHLENRLFVLEPLEELSAEFTLPSGTSLKESIWRLKQEKTYDKTRACGKGVQPK